MNPFNALNMNKKFQTDEAKSFVPPTTSVRVLNL